MMSEEPEDNMETGAISYKTVLLITLSAVLFIVMAEISAILCFSYCKDKSSSTSTPEGDTEIGGESATSPVTGTSYESTTKPSRHKRRKRLLIQSINDPKYLCCCGRMTAKTGAKVVAMVDFLFATAKLISIYYWIHLMEGSTSSVYMTIVPILCCLGGIIVTILLLVAIHIEKPALIGPYICMTITSIVVLGIYSLYPIVALAKGDFGIALAGAALVGSVILIHMWFIVVVRQLMKFYKDKREMMIKVGYKDQYEIVRPADQPDFGAILKSLKKPVFLPGIKSRRSKQSGE